MIRLYRNLWVIVCGLAMVSWAGVMSASAGEEAESGKPKKVTADDFREHRVILMGDLGLPLGTVAEVEATVIDGGPPPEFLFTNVPPSMRVFLLSVERVNGVPFAEPRVVRFFVPSFARLPVGTVLLAPTRTDLDELLKSCQRSHRLTEAQAQELEREYIGSHHRLVVYEAARFDGRPDNLPDDSPVWGGFGFRFETRLVVLTERGLREERSLGEER